MGCFCMSLVIFQFPELTITAINELDFFFSTEKGVKRNVPLSMRCVLYSFDGDAFLCPLLQNCTALAVWLTCTDTLWFCPLSSSFSSQGWFPLLQVVVTELLCMSCSCTCSGGWLCSELGCCGSVLWALLVPSSSYSSTGGECAGRRFYR